MAVAEIIGAAIGVLLLVVVAYLLVGGTLSAAETVMSAQNDVTLLHENRIGTQISLSGVSTPGGGVMNMSVSNNGSVGISDLPHMDVFSYDATNGYVHYTYVPNSLPALDPNTLDPQTWTTTWYLHDNIHARQLDPGVTMRIEMKLPDGGPAPTFVQVTTGNGVSAVSGV
jgi:archaeal flagellar protein FlaF